MASHKQLRQHDKVTSQRSSNRLSVPEQSNKHSDAVLGQFACASYLVPTQGTHPASGPRAFAGSPAPHSAVATGYAPRRCCLALLTLRDAAGALCVPPTLSCLCAQRERTPLCLTLWPLQCSVAVWGATNAPSPRHLSRPPETHEPMCCQTCIRQTTKTMHPHMHDANAHART